MNATLALAATVGAYLTVGSVAAILIVAAATVLVTLIAVITMVAIFGSEHRRHAALTVLHLLLDIRNEQRKPHALKNPPER